MTVSRCIAALLVAATGIAACSKPATTTTTSATPASTPLVAGTTPAAAASTAAPVLPATGGYSCSFPGPDGRSILARFTLEGAGAHDDQGLPFTILANSPTALVLAHPRDDLASAPNGDVGAYVVAIDRRSLGMVQTTVGLNGPGATRRGRCIAG